MNNKFVTVEMPTLIKFFFDNVSLDNMDEEGNYPINFKFDIDILSKFIDEECVKFGSKKDIEFGTYLINDEESTVEIYPDEKYSLINKLKLSEELNKNIKITDKVDL